jgi:ribosome-associated protein
MSATDTVSIADELRQRISEKELDFRFVRSSGPGGQNVNKLNTRVTVTFDLAGTRSLTDSEKRRISRKLHTRISKEGLLRVACCQYRTQAANRRLALKRFYDFLAEALRPSKPRMPTAVPRRSREARIREKKTTSERKRYRQRPSRGDGDERS